MELTRASNVRAAPSFDILSSLPVDLSLGRDGDLCHGSWSVFLAHRCQTTAERDTPSIFQDTGSAKPVARLCIILRDTAANLIHDTENRLCLDVAGLR